MRTTAKIVLVIIIITLVYSVVKLINASTTPQEETITTITLPVNQPTKNMQNTQANMPQNTAMQPAQEIAPATPKQNTTNQNTQATYQADEILIDGQGQAGQNYIDITSDTPITPQQQTQTQNTQNTQNNNGGGAYAEASVSINNNRANTNTQTYAPGVPAFEVIDGN